MPLPCRFNAIRRARTLLGYYTRPRCARYARRPVVTRISPQHKVAIGAFKQEIAQLRELEFFAPRSYQLYPAVSRLEQFAGTGVEVQGDEESEEQYQRSFSAGENLANHALFALGLVDGKGVPVPVSEEVMEARQERTSFIVESVLTYMRQVYICSSLEEFNHATLQFIRCVTGQPVMKAFARIWEIVKTVVMSLVEDVQSMVQSDEPENPFKIFRRWLLRADTMDKHPIVEKIKSVFYHILSFSLLESFGITWDSFWFSKAEAELKTKEHSSKYGFLYSLLDGATFIMERMYDCYLTKSWGPLIHTSGTYAKWVDDFYAFKIELAKMPNPEAHGTSYHEIMQKLTDLLERGRAIVKYMEGSKPEKQAAKRLLSELEIEKANLLTSSAAAQSREAPFTILYYGGSAIAKSTLQHLSFMHIGKTLTLPTGDEYHYTRVFSDKFYSKFRTSQWSIVLDDIASRQPTLGLDPSMEDVLQIVNEVAFTPPQADLMDKGNTPMRPVLVQATTNTKHLNASSYYCNSLAIQRRFPLVVTPTLKESVCKLFGGVAPPPEERVIDPARVPVLEEGDYPDLWEFQIETVKAVWCPLTKTQSAKYVPADLPYTDNIYRYMAYLSMSVEKHRHFQSKKKESAGTYSAVQLCDGCCRPKKHCFCATELQSGDVLLGAVAGAALGAAGWALGPIVKTLVKNQVTTLAKEVVQETILDAAQKVTKAFSPPPVKEEEEEFFDAEEYIGDSVDEIRANASALPFTQEERWEYERQMIRAMLEKAGAATRKKKQVAVPLLRFLGGFMMLFGVYKLYKLSQEPPSVKVPLYASCSTKAKIARMCDSCIDRAMQSSQGSWEVGAREFPKDAEANPWYKEEFSTAHREVGPVTRGWSTMARQEIVDRISRNVSYTEVVYTKPDGVAYKRPCRTLCLGGQLYVTNNHNLPYADMKLRMVGALPRDQVGDYFEFRLVEAKIHRIVAQDLAFFVVPNVPPRRSLRGLIAGADYQTIAPGTLISRGPDGRISTQPLKALRKEGCHGDSIGDFVGFAGHAQTPTEKGDCGSPYVAFSPKGPVLLGVHTLGGGAAGTSDWVACTYMHSAHVEAAVAALQVDDVQSGELDLKTVTGEEIALLPLHTKSVFRYMETGVANVYGSLPGFRATHKSKVVKTMLNQPLKEMGVEDTFGAPRLGGWKPWRLAVSDTVNQTFSMDSGVLEECADAYFDDIAAGISDEDLKEICVLDNESTLNGIPDVKYIDKMNRQTSMGWPWKEPKSKHLIYKGEYDIWQDYVEFPPEFYKRVDKIIANYESGVMNHSMFIGHLKDEVLSEQKVLAGKARVFSIVGADMAFTMRKYLLPLVRVIQKNRFLFECAPGTNATSMEWDEMFHYLTQHGRKRMVAGDYSKFDKRMSAEVILLAFRILIRLMERAGVEEKHLKVVRMMRYDVAFPTVDMNGDVVQFWGSNPSGHPLTVIINSIVNSIYVRYAYKMSSGNLALFKKQIALMTYGDDNIMGIDAEVDFFDHTVLQSQLAKVGVVYTMADKEAASVPFLDISDTSFLKRRWVLDPDFGSHVAQLEEESIVKRLLWHEPSEDVCPEVQNLDAMEGALREWAFYGRETFEQKKEEYRGLVTRLDLQDYQLRPFPQFDDLVGAYQEYNKRFSPDGRCSTCCPA